MEWVIVYEKYCKAVDMVVAAVEPYLNYGISCKTEIPEDKSVIYVGFDKTLDDGFHIKVGKAENDIQRIDITAPDEINLMYAAVDFKNKYLPYVRNFNNTAPIFYFNELFSKPMKEYDLISKPKIKDRGIWTWGYVIYDYKSFVDNMVKCKLNTLIVWNDYLPLNIKEVLDYCHANGVKLYLGYAWGWDVSLTVCDTISKLDEIGPQVIKDFKEQYAALGCDGIYFQSFTEVGTEDINGKPVAETVTNFVNDIGGKILEEYPDLKLLFGLHATSVNKKLDIIKNVDDRISIIWEDAGAFPYQYVPCNIDGFDVTLEFTKKIRDLRENGEFGVVLKGVTCLNWMQFKHQSGEFVLGESSKQFIKNRTEFKRELLRYIQAYWIRNAKYCHDVIKEFKSDSMVTMLCEDGMFEDVLNYPMAIFSEMLWNPDAKTEDILCEAALRTDVDFV